MKLNDYQKETERTAPSIDDQEGCLINFSMGLSGESGEFTDHIKKVVFQGHPLSYSDAEEELGDILYYLARAADALGLTLEEVAQTNINKLKKRYPNGFTTKDSMQRRDVAE
ncbi:nucleoside triphosphate pyrophosphohydrolase family protein [Virgibacillus sediminis]|uniref:Nucleoside triphosphate pyrophosphohydrolase family protein n=1 Tax=Virgibacillus sediminis TaxID=202260 RepID=A0ABV7A642_9BACI